MLKSDWAAIYLQLLRVVYTGFTRLDPSSPCEGAASRQRQTIIDAYSIYGYNYTQRVDYIKDYIYYGCVVYIIFDYIMDNIDYVNVVYNYYQ